VPLERFYDALRWIKENTELIINVHTGLIDEEGAEELASTGIDIASVDVVGSDETIRRVYGLRATVEDYRKTLNSLMETSIPAVVPHLCVGLDYGRILGEAKALEIIWEAQPRQMVILALIPTPGTPMEEVRPPPPRDVAKVTSLARLLMPETSISLGCMRPRAERESLETLCLKAGADRMVLPSRATRSWAESQGLKILELDGCCSIPEKLEARALRA
ncbi:radical SAM protein, partial [Candidatus Bathyarchaeota archaeon]